jgi:UDP-N-acetylglucosamine 2-epimerase (non-hydrolysing)
MADIMIGLEKIFLSEKPDLVVVVGDVNSTLSAALVANKMGIKLAHVEAGLRSGNKLMPEETNRILTDKLSDLLFVTEEDGVANLKREGITKGVYSVGNIMIDTLTLLLPKVKKSTEHFYFCTLHRAENVDNKKVFAEILDALEEISHDAVIYLPLHPRTAKMAEKFGLEGRLKKIFKILPPLSYQETLYYQKNAKLVLTDSGGIQEETSFLGTPCLTLRTETERPITVKKGTNKIAGVTRASILKAYVEHPRKHKKTKIPLWDGKTAKRIVKILKFHSLLKV